MYMSIDRITIILLRVLSTPSSRDRSEADGPLCETVCDLVPSSCRARSMIQTVNERQRLRGNAAARGSTNLVGRAHQLLQSKPVSGHVRSSSDCAPFNHVAAQENSMKGCNGPALTASKLLKCRCADACPSKIRAFLAIRCSPARMCSHASSLIPNARKKGNLLCRH